MQGFIDFGDFSGEFDDWTAAESGTDAYVFAEPERVYKPAT
jgi:hypothetical protein